MVDIDRKVRKQIRKELQQDIRMVRRQLDAHAVKLKPDDADDQRTAAQIPILDAYALAAQTALSVDVLQPFPYASPVMDDALTAIATSLDGLEKGGPTTAVVTAKRARLQAVIGRRKQWRDDLTLVRRLHGDGIAAEGILSGATLEHAGQPVTHTTVRARYASWCAELRTR